MKHYVTVALVLLLLSPIAFAKGKKQSTTYEGTIAKIDKNRINVNFTDSNNQNLRTMAYVDNDTVITLDGKPAVLRDLAPSMFVTMKMANNLIAASIDARNRGNDWKR